MHQQNAHTTFYVVFQSHSVDASEDIIYPRKSSSCIYEGTHFIYIYSKKIVHLIILKLFAVIFPLRSTGHLFVRNNILFRYLQAEGSKCYQSKGTIQQFLFFPF